MEANEPQTEEEKSFSSKFKRYIKNLFDFSQYDKKTILYVAIFVFLLVFSIIILIYNYVFNPTFLLWIVATWFVNPVHDLGILGIILFLVIMAIQGLIVPLPSEIVLLATGIIWGWFIGGLFGIIGSMLAGILCFYISRKGGRPLVEKFVGSKTLNLADDLIKKYGIWTIIISRFIPFISFDVISYASGLVDIDFKKYSIGTFIGSTFRAFFYSVIGSFLGIKPPIDVTDAKALEAQATIFNVWLLIILGVLILMFVAYYLTNRYLEKKKINQQEM
jgi:uncharacterized membrane protein YdjX (TVP38/TMEM64 family)